MTYSSKEFKLFIDETGSSFPSTNVGLPYVLLGCVIAQEYRMDLKNHADQIKFKYWGRTDIVFHSNEIGKNIGEFSIFANNQPLRDEFIKDLLNFLRRSPVLVNAVIVNKEAISSTWKESTIVSKTAKALFYNFIALLFTKDKANGRVVIESATSSKDKEYLNAFAFFLSPNCPMLDQDFSQVRDVVTSISFVTKQNHDVEEQVADLFSYAARCKYLKENKGASIISGSYEDKLLSIFETKLFRAPTNAGPDKMRFYQKINPFAIIP